MTFLRALRTYIGLGPDEEVEGRYLEELNARRRDLQLAEIGSSTEVDSRPRRGSGRSSPANGGNRKSGQPQRKRHSAGSEPVERRRRPAAAQRSETRAAEEPIEWGSGDPFADPDIGDTDGHDAVNGYLDDYDATENEGDVLIDLRDTGQHVASPFKELAAELRSESEHERVSSAEQDEGAVAVVRSLDVMRSKPKTVLPDSFADAKVVADEFKRGIPIVLNLQGIERDLARRLIDFASGVCYSLDGSMEKLASQVFLLLPEDVEVSEQDRRLIIERGYAR